MSNRPGVVSVENLSLRHVERHTQLGGKVVGGAVRSMKDAILGGGILGPAARACRETPT